MSLSEQTTAPSVEGLGASAREFLAYCEAERERRRNSGEAFDEAAFDQAVDMVLGKLRVLADEGWS